MAGSFAVNNIPYDHASLELTIDDLVVVGRRGISFEYGFDVMKLFGATREALSRTDGIFNVEDQEITMLESDYHSIVAKFGNGFMTEQAKFAGLLTYAVPGNPIHRVDFVDMRIITAAHDYQQGPDGLEVSVTTSAMKLKIVGYDPANRAA